MTNTRLLLKRNNSRYARGKRVAYVERHGEPLPADPAHVARFLRAEPERPVPKRVRIARQNRRGRYRCEGKEQGRDVDEKEIPCSGLIEFILELEECMHRPVMIS